jgi:hypothetical protein
MKQDALPSLLVSLTLEYAISGVQVKKDVLKLSGAHQILVYTDNVNV